MSYQWNQSLEPKKALIALKEVDIRNSSLLMGVGRHNNFNREINGMQILGVTITTHITFAWHGFEKLNMYITPMLLFIFRISKRFIFFMCFEKRLKIKLVAIICMTSSVFWKKNKKSISNQRLHCHFHSLSETLSVRWTSNSGLTI